MSVFTIDRTRPSNPRRSAPFTTYDTVRSRLGTRAEQSDGRETIVLLDCAHYRDKNNVLNKQSHFYPCEVLYRRLINSKQLVPFCSWDIRYRTVKSNFVFKISTFVPNV